MVGARSARPTVLRCSPHANSGNDAVDPYPSIAVVTGRPCVFSQAVLVVPSGWLRPRYMSSSG